MRASWQKGDNPGGHGHGADIVDHGAEGLEDVEGADDEDGQEQGVVVKDAEGGGLVLSDLVLFPEDTLVFFFTWDLFVSGIQLENKFAISKKGLLY